MEVTSTPPDIQAAVTMVFFLLLFGWWGFRRGFWREFIVLIGLIFLRYNQGTLLLSVLALLRILVRVFLVLPQVKAKGAEVVITTIQKTPPLVKSGTVDEKIMLFISFLVMVVLIYLISSVFRRRWPALGVFVGALNGYLLGYWLLPALPHALPEPAVIGGGAHSAAGSRAGRVLMEGLSKTQYTLGLDPSYLFYLFIVFIVAAILWAVSELE